jgi:predicted dehydrogenase
MEKPAFASSSQFDVVRAAADATGRQVFVAENYVYKPIARFLRDVITSGDLGDVRFVSLNATRWQAASGWRADPALSGGGALFESGVHWISLAARLGLAIESVQGFRVGAETGTDRSSLSVIRFATGAMGTLAHSWELPAPLGGLRISKVQGTRGAVTFESNGLMSITSGRRKGVRLHLVDAMGYRAMHADFQRAITRQVSASYTLEMAHDDFRWLEVVQRDLTGPSSHALVPEYTCVP